MRFFLSYLKGFLALTILCVFSSIVQAETLKSALARAYANNPSLNAERAALRATDESVPQALSNYRPTVSASGSIGSTSTRTRSFGQANSSTLPANVGITLSQNLFRGLRTINGTKAAEAQVKAARYGLKNTEQNILLQAVEAYMNVLRDQAIVRLNKQNIVALKSQLDASRNRLAVGEGTRTDVAQSQARVAQSQSQLNFAQASLAANKAIYAQIIGVAPSKLISPKMSLMKYLPMQQSHALSVAMAEHPAIKASEFSVNAASFNSKTVEGELLPTVTLEGSVGRQWNPSSSVNSVDSASIIGRVNVPLYQAGSLSSRVRQSKEIIGQRRLELDVSREQVKAAVISALGNLRASQASIIAARAQVSASDIALQGVLEERKVGQRTTLDVLNSRQELLNAKVNLITAQRDSVVASYSLLSAIGRLSAKQLHLSVTPYQPEEHYNKVRDKWYGIRTPDGR